MRLRASSPPPTGPGDDDIFVAFEPTQVKSATSNKGTYDPANDDIMYSFDSKDVDAWSEENIVKNFGVVDMGVRKVATIQLFLELVIENVLATRHTEGLC